MTIEVFNRYEKKYFVTDEQLCNVLSEIEQHMTPDKHNPTGQTYPISNIYYDTSDDYLIRTSLAHPAYKEKLRLRTYGIPGQSDEAFLEIKKKVNGLVNKRRTSIGLQDAYRFMEEKGQELRRPLTGNSINPQVMKELIFMIHRYELMPKVMIAYDRLAYFEKGNPDLRVSFDTNIRGRRNDLRLEAGNFGRLIIPRGLWLMEIKTARAIPLWLAAMLSAREIRRVSFSKYGREYEQNLVQSDANNINVVNSAAASAGLSTGQFLAPNFSRNLGLIKEGLKSCLIQ